MKIITEKYDYEDTNSSVEGYVQSKLDGDDYERGTLEAARATADNAVNTLGRLLEALTRKQVLSGVELVEIVEGFNPYSKVELDEAPE